MRDRCAESQYVTMLNRSVCFFVGHLSSLPNDERVHHYQRGRAPITGLKLWSSEVIETERLEVVVTARRVLPWVLMGEAFGFGKAVLMFPNSG